jgi:hypothetical protein
MSVTFSAEDNSPADTTQWELYCDASGTDIRLGDVWTGYRNAAAEADAHGLLCGACEGYGAQLREVHADGAPVPLNVNNRNAHDLLAALGYLGEPLDDAAGLLGGPVYDLCGADDARAFRDRVELALGVTRPADAGLPALTYRGGTPAAPGATVYDCGREPGYLTGRLEQLRELASRCVAAGVRVTWA